MRSLRARLFLAFAGTMLAVLAAVLVAIVLGLQFGLAGSQQESIERQAQLIANLVKRGGTINNITLGSSSALLNERALIVPLPRALQLLAPEPVARLRAGEQVSGTVDFLGGRYRYVAVPANDSAVLVLARGRESVSARPYLLALFVAAVIAAVVGFVVSFFVARGLSRPVARVAEAADAVAAGGTPSPVPEHGPTELRSLAASFNEMSGQLSRAKQSQQAFLLSVSHELKTPAAAVRGYAEAQKEGVVEPAEASDYILRESERLERLIADLLDMARLDQHEFAISVAPLDLRAVAGDVLQRYSQQARAFEVLLTVPEAPESPALADHGRLVQIVSNLVENALRSTPSGGSVEIVTAPGEVSVHDTGPGLTSEEAERAFDRFYLYRRFGGTRPVGTGLGLALVKELVDAMGGTVRVDSRLGWGASFIVTLPRPEEEDGAEDEGEIPASSAPPQA